MPNTAYQKGYREEHRLVQLLQAAGFRVERTHASGAWQKNAYDIKVSLLGKDRRCEVKHHGQSFKRIYDWLKPVDMLVVRADRHEALVILPLRLALEIAKAAETSWEKA